MARCGCSRSPTSATPGPACSPRRSTAAGDELDIWHIAETAEPPADPLGYDAVIDLRRRDARRPGRPPPLARGREGAAARAARARHAAARRLPRRPAARRGGRRRGAARRASPRSAGSRSRSTAAGADDPLLGPLAPRFEAFEWHSYECVLPAGGGRARPHARSACRRSGSAPAWGIQFHAEVGAADARALDRRLPRPTRTRSGSASTRSALAAPRPTPRSRAFNRARARALRALARRGAALLALGREVGAGEAAVDHEGRGGDVARTRRWRGRAPPCAISARLARSGPAAGGRGGAPAFSGSFANSSCSSGVLTGPGQSALTRTPRRANSTPSSRDSASTAPFEAV